jgi:hypothetical protein
MDEATPLTGQDLQTRPRWAQFNIDHSLALTVGLVIVVLVVAALTRDWALGVIAIVVGGMGISRATWTRRRPNRLRRAD